MSDVFSFPKLGLASNGCLAPPDVSELDQFAIDDISNGCGPAGAKRDLVPDAIVGVDLYRSCSIHDVCYQLGLDESDKRWADILLLVNALLAVNERFPGDDVVSRARRFVARRAAFDYYLAVASWGHAAFWAGKREETES